MMLQNEEKKLLTYVTNQLKKNPEVEAIILFGSYAKGKQKPLSDIDLCVLTEKKISERVKAKIVSNSSSKIDISLFWDLPSSIRYTVLREGKILFKRDTNLFHTSLMETMREYLDFQHIIKRSMARIFVQ